MRLFLPMHQVSTAYERGWSTLKNGELLRIAELHAFAVLITTDGNLKYRQNLAERRISLVVLTTTSWPRIRAHADRVVAAVNAATPGSYFEVQFS